MLKQWLAGATAVFLSFLFGLTLTRWGYEALFPQALWLGRWPGLIAAAIPALLGGWAWNKLRPRLGDFSATAVFLPFALNTITFTATAVQPLDTPFYLLSTLWLCANLLRHTLTPLSPPQRDLRWLMGFIGPIYLLTLGRTVGQADTFEFQVVIPRLQIAHPTGYPLYILLTRPFVWLPWGSVAWRVNLGTAVYAILAISLLYLLVRQITRQNLVAVVTAVAFALTPTFWSQAIQAEVYTLHAALLAASFYIITTAHTNPPANSQRDPFLHLPLLLGLGLTNHLTTLLLLPSALLLWWTKRQAAREQWWRGLLAFLAPLLLYAYLPIRWYMIHGEAMGLSRFVDWVIGGRFQGALQLMAWWRDPTRYAVVGRLLLAEWGGNWYGAIILTLAGIGFLWLTWRQWQLALPLGLAWGGFTFYALNYYVPDLAVFLIPTHLITAVFLGVTLATLTTWKPHIGLAGSLLLLLAILSRTPDTWQMVDRSGDDGLTTWGKGVLSLPLAVNSAILADSEKIAPLYYLQQAEGLRRDLDILVLPDEATYRAELDGRIAAGQTVYLARYLPGLAGIYHLRSRGPLTEVSPTPLPKLPDTAVPTNLTFPPLQLIGYEVQPIAAYDSQATAVTLYWQATAPVNQPWYVYVRWSGQPPLLATGQHPANNSYPTNAWQAGEVVSDFYLLPHPHNPLTGTTASPLQLALAPAFTPADALSWQTVTAVTLPTPTISDINTRPYRLQFPSLTLTGADFPAQIRPQTPLPVTLIGWGDPSRLQLTLRSPLTITPEPVAIARPTQAPPAHLPADTPRPFIHTLTLPTDLPAGDYELVLEVRGETAVCGWQQRPQPACILGQVTLSGLPLPAEAINFNDQIALLGISLPDTPLTPGGQLPVTLTWQALTPLDKNYTLFLQVLDAEDRIVGQSDAWPLQGTLPTSQWTPGQTLTDPYTLQLSPDLPPGNYRLIIGWYLLADLRRLPVLDAQGQPIDDKVTRAGLVVEELID